MSVSKRVIKVLEFIWDNPSKPFQWTVTAIDTTVKEMHQNFFAKYILSRDEHRITIICHNRDCGIELAKEVAAAYLDYIQTGYGKSSLGEWIKVDLDDL